MADRGRPIFARVSREAGQRTRACHQVITAQGRALAELQHTYSCEGIPHSGTADSSSRGGDRSPGPTRANEQVTTVQDPPAKSFAFYSLARNMPGMQTEKIPSWVHKW